MPRRRRPPRAGALGDLQPLKIASQIAILQTLFYVSALVLMLFTTLVAGTAFSLDLVLGWDRVRGDTTQGWLVAFIWLLDGGFCMAVAIVALIARSKLVPDFALTIQCLHLVFTMIYTRSLPRNAMWWATMAASSGVAVALGIWGCRYRELQPVFFGGGRILGAGGHAATPSGQQTQGAGGPAEAAALMADVEDQAGDDEIGYPPRGRRGRGGQGGAGEFEMSKMASSK